MNWILLWKLTLIFTLSGYSLLVVIVFFGGIRNIIDMFKDLKDPDRQ